MDTFRRRRRVLVCALAVALGVFAFLYRFNALGGALGGFDNDHFMFFVRSRVVLHGERPLRDFADAGLQGAWPSLTYLLSAEAQRWFGETLRSEAVLTVAGVATATVIMFVAATRVAAVWASLAVALLTLLVGTKLYNYPRAITFALLTAVTIWYAKRRSTLGAGVLGACIAVAFLFRHDFAVYAAGASLVLILASRPPLEWRTTLRHLAFCGFVAAILLTPSLLWIQRHAGIGHYVQEGLSMGQREAQRTSLRWPRFEAAPARAFFSTEANAVAWLYYASWALPLVALALVMVRRAVALTTAGPSTQLENWNPDALIVSLAVLALLLNYFFLRGNLAGRFGDLGAPIGVLAAIMLSPSVRETRRRAALRWATAIGLLLPTVLSVSVLGSVVRELDTTGLSDSLEKVHKRIHRVSSELSAEPGSSADAVPIPAAAAYLRACTRPDDRVLITASATELLALANRDFAGGQATFIAGFYDSEQDQQLTLERLGRQRVPVVLTPDQDVYDEEFAPEFQLLHRYLSAHYSAVGSLDGGTDEVRVLVNRSIPSVRTDTATGFPCFR